VDPDKNSSEGVASLLRDMGSDVEIAQDGPGALALDRTFRPDIAIIDLGLKGMDAYTLARLLGAEPQRPFTLVSAADPTYRGENWRWSDAGFRYALMKPICVWRLRWMFISLGLADETPGDLLHTPVEECQRGTITEEEFAVRAFECAARFDPAEIAHAIPEALLEVVRRFAASPPQDTSDVSPGWWLAFDDYEIERRREAAFQGAWNWFRFFNP
jgi:CheY-like chemotaxis protein